MEALVATGAPGGVEIADVPGPARTPDQLLVDVRAISINRGELHRLESCSPGWRPGWDFAGTVTEPVGAGEGPRAGDRVFGCVPGAAWAERLAAPADHVAVLPDELSWAQGAALPVAGITARRILALGDSLPGARVLVVGAAGGVGRLAVQLADQAGADVTAVVGSSTRGDGLAGMGATHVVVGIDRADGEFDLVLESAGGASLARALSLVAPGGTVVTFGNSSRAASTIRIDGFYPKEASLHGFYFWRDLERRAPAGDLVDLAAMARRGALRVDVAHCLPWGEHSALFEQLRNRTADGKVIVALDGGR